jgi:hypothetical protein
VILMQGVIQYDGTVRSWWHVWKEQVCSGLGVVAVDDVVLDQLSPKSNWRWRLLMLPFSIFVPSLLSWLISFAP